MPAKKKKATKKASNPIKKAVKKNDDSKGFAFLTTFLSILGFIIALLAKKDDKYVMFYAKQSLVVFIAWIIAAILSIVPVLGWILEVIVLVLWVISWVYALSGKEKEVPIIGKFARKFNI